LDIFCFFFFFPEQLVRIQTIFYVDSLLDHLCLSFAECLTCVVQTVVQSSKLNKLTFLCISLKCRIFETSKSALET